MKLSNCSNDLLESMRLARPCDKDWDSMPGDERVRFCSGCAKSVYNISDMTTGEAKDFLRARGVTECMRVFRRSDGTVINDDCPRIFRKIRNGARFFARSVAAVVGLMMSSSFAYAQTTKSTEPEKLDVESLRKKQSESGVITPNPILPYVTGSVDFGGFREGIEFGYRPKLEDWEVATAIRNRKFGLKTTSVRELLLDQSVFGRPVNDLEEIFQVSANRQQNSDHARIDFALSLLVRDKAEDMTKAREILESVARKSPRDTQALYSLAVLDELENKTDSAASRYWNLYQIDSSFKQSMVNLFDLYLREGKRDKAKSVINELLKTMGPYTVRELLSGDLNRLDKRDWPAGLTPPPIIEPGFHGYQYW